MPTKTDCETTSPDTGNRNMSADTENRNISADTAPGSSSADTETDHLFRETESKDASREITIDNSSLDTDSTDTPETLTLARLDRENQGTWEAEYSYGGEADLHRHYTNCTKNPGHKNFIPADKFSIEDLPEGYRDKDMVDYIRAVSDLTVRVKVKYVSNKRPETVSGKPFPGYPCRGHQRNTVGTGWVQSASVHKHITCKCKDCLTSSKPQTKFGEIYMRTARHVVYDESDAIHTTCHLYFDKGGSPETCEGVVALTGMSGSFGSGDTDQYYMSHYTHDLDLALRLDQRCKQRNDLLTKIWEKSPYKWNFEWSRPAPDKQPLLFIVSHPHGCSKQISIGRCHSLLTLTNKQWGYTYTTATCPGSSGAGIQILNEAVYYPLKIHMSGQPPVHRGVCDIQPRMNFSLFYEGRPIPEIVSQNLMWRDGEGLRSEDICSAEEEDLHKHYDTCQHNPGHQNFFPVDKFSADHLPPCECKDDIMKLIKVLSDLTVRLSVTYVSAERPKTVPGTEIEVPCFRKRGSNQLSVKSNHLRIGSGRIKCVQFLGSEIVEYNDSDRPIERQGAIIYIHTVNHLVYDYLEAEQTTCHLFFDSGEIPNACQDVVILTKVWDTINETYEDKFTLMYYTHDLALAHKLKESVQLYEDLKSQCDRSYRHEIVKQSERNNLTPNSPLYIVVSHPHGRAKHVSVSYPGCHGNTDKQEMQRPYKSITCPGSGGAPVIALGPQTLYPCLE